MNQLSLFIDNCLEAGLSPEKTVDNVLVAKDILKLDPKQSTGIAITIFTLLGCSIKANKALFVRLEEGIAGNKLKTFETPLKRLKPSESDKVEGPVANTKVIETVASVVRFHKGKVLARNTIYEQLLWNLQ